MLKKCLAGYTQNANDCVNSVIWKFAPKVKYHGLVVVKTATAIATSMFNDGAVCLGHILEKLGVDVHTFTKDFFERKDATRIICAQRQSVHASKEYRRRRRFQRLGKDEEDAQREGCPYMTGAH